MYIYSPHCVFSFFLQWCLFFVQLISLGYCNLFLQVTLTFTGHSHTSYTSLINVLIHSPYLLFLHTAPHLLIVFHGIIRFLVQFSIFLCTISESFKPSFLNLHIFMIYSVTAVTRQFIAFIKFSSFKFLPTNCSILSLSFSYFFIILDQQEKDDTFFTVLVLPGVPFYNLLSLLRGLQ